MTAWAPNHARDNEIGYVNVCPQREHKTNADAVAVWVALFMSRAEAAMSLARLGGASRLDGPRPGVGRAGVAFVHQLT